MKSSHAKIIALLAYYLLTSEVQAYPLIAQVSEESQRCFKFTIPQDDDAHMVFMALPMNEDLTGDHKEAKLEGWMVQEMYELTNRRQGDNLPSSLVNSPPADIQSQMDAYLEKRGRDPVSKMKLAVTLETTRHTSRVLPLKYFAPTVLNKVRENHKKINIDAGREDDDTADISSFNVCFDNQGNPDDQVQVVWDIVMVNAEINESNEPNFEKEKHLSPLEESLERSIRAANTVLREMKYMTDREERMRKTADSINQRVQYFSVLSVLILLGVTYVQVTYLKRYFKKKKLM